MGSLHQAAAVDVVIDGTAEQQTIRGFGASSAWYGGSITDEQADTFFSVEKGLGLSILRMRITPDGTTIESNTARKAIERGAVVWAAPWSPPAAWKTNNSEVNGGKLLPDRYQDWADRLADFAASRAQQGIPLFALSAQNEPNWVADWETCQWTPQELVKFIRDYLAPAVRAKSPDTLILGPETIDWFSLAQYADAILEDKGARDAIGIVAVHSYGGTAYRYQAPVLHGKEFWQTEVSSEVLTGIAAGLETARHIHDHLTIAGVNAWHYWWILSESNTSLMRDGELVTPAYALGQYSKFVRPGAFRVTVSPSNPEPGVLVSAYRHLTEKRTVVVAINSNEAPHEQSFDLEGVEVETVTPWTTSAVLSLAEQPTIATTSSFSYSLPATSITTFVVNEPGYGEPPPIGGAGGTGGTDGSDDAGAGAGGANDESGGAESGGAPGEAGAGGSPDQSGGTGPIGAGAGGTGADSGSPAGGISSTPGHAGSHPAPSTPRPPQSRGRTVSAFGCSIDPTAPPTAPAALSFASIAWALLRIRRTRRPA